MYTTRIPTNGKTKSSKMLRKETDIQNQPIINNKIDTTNRIYKDILFQRYVSNAKRHAEKHRRSEMKQQILSDYDEILNL
jgi:hypothetical protein